MEENEVTFSSRRCRHLIDAVEGHRCCKNQTKMMTVEVDFVTSNIRSTRELLLVAWVPYGPENKHKPLRSLGTREEQSKLCILCLELQGIVIWKVCNVHISPHPSCGVSFSTNVVPVL